MIGIDKAKDGDISAICLRVDRHVHIVPSPFAEQLLEKFEHDEKLIVRLQKENDRLSAINKSLMKEVNK